MADIQELVDVASAIARLTEERRLLITQLHAAGHSFPELASAGLVSVGTAHSIVTRATKHGLVSVGYEGRSVEDLLGILHRHHVTLLIDVRLNAISRRPGFSKRALGEALSAAGIEYRHARELGNPKDNRAGLRAGEPLARQRFLEHMAISEDALADVTAEAGHRVVALLCVERSHDTCHRSCIASAAIERTPGLPLVTA